MLLFNDKDDMEGSENISAEDKQKITGFMSELNALHDSISERRLESISKEIEIKKIIYTLESQGYDKNQINEIFSERMSAELRDDSIAFADEHGFIPDVSYMLNDGENMDEILRKIAEKSAKPTENPRNNIADILNTADKIEMINSGDDADVFIPSHKPAKSGGNSTKISEDNNNMMLDIAFGCKPLSSMIDITTDPNILIGAIRKISPGPPRSLNWQKKNALIRQISEICGPKYIEYMLVTVLNNQIISDKN